MKQTAKMRMLDRPLTELTHWDWEKTLYAVLIIVALTSRLWGLGDRVQSHDESIHTKYSWNLYAGHGFQHDPLMHGPYLFHVTALSYFFFGDNDFSARIPVALMGVAIVAFPWLLRRWLGRFGALATALFLLISPSIAYYSRYIRHDIPIILWSLIIIWAIFAYLRDGRERWLYLMAAGVSLGFATKEVAFIYNAIFGFFLIGLFVVQAMERRWSNENLKLAVQIALVTAVIGLVIVVIVELSLLIKPNDQSTLGWLTILGGLLTGLGLLGALGLVLIGTWSTWREYRSFDLTILLGTLCLPFLSPLPIAVIGLDPLHYKAPIVYASAAIIGTVILISAAVGLLWNWRRWSVAAAIHYAIFAVLFTTVFTNGFGLASGMVGSLGYWLAQHEVQRGSQPEYYYVVMVFFYEYLPALLTLVTGGYLAYSSGKRFLLGLGTPPSDDSAIEKSTDDNVENMENKSAAPVPTAFLAFLFWWIITAWGGYSYAGERMPWLTVHIALPMILLSGWLVGRLIEQIDWRRVIERRVWLVALLAPPFVAALAAFLATIRSGIFQGYELAQLNNTLRFIGGLLGVLGFGGGLLYLIYRSGRTATRVLLLVALSLPVFLTMRTAWRFCFVTHDYPTEFLVYAHAAPAVHDTMDRIREISRRVTGVPELIQVAYGSDGSTLWYWQLRNFPNAIFYGETPSRDQMEAPIVIAGRNQWDAVAPYMDRGYVVDTYTYLWWPMEDYRNLEWLRPILTDSNVRAALWDIWYDRDYRRYDQLAGKTHNLDQWPLRSDYRLYIRRDLAGEIWDLGMTQLTGAEAIGPIDPYEQGWREIAARHVFGGQGSEPGWFQAPRDVSIGPDGAVYVVDGLNHRVQKFTPEGDFLTAWGVYSTLEMESGRAQGFNDPWGIAVGEEAVYVADTWNHRIQKMDLEGNLLRVWGQFGEYQTLGHSAFYGPRGVTLGPDGLVYVTDTGNKRVQVFETDGTFAFQWGGSGVVEGYLDEPVGIAFDPEQQEIYVADTWNRRVQVFQPDGAFIRQWPIVGWDAGLGDEKPYLALDGQGHVYVTDPGHYRVLVFDRMGNYLLSFGRYGMDDRSFALPTGIAVTDDGVIYVADTHGNRILVFDPLNFTGAGVRSESE
ncbi:MAG TPA: TIGR03663 family protein [Chloroflexi bacterium]|nr:TIGR03663 family protein [Chloroflexota bacterium]